MLLATPGLSIADFAFVFSNQALGIRNAFRFAATVRLKNNALGC